MAEVDVVDLQNGEYCAHQQTGRQTRWLLLSTKMRLCCPWCCSLCLLKTLQQPQRCARSGETWRRKILPLAVLFGMVESRQCNRSVSLALSPSSLSLRITRLARSPCVLTTDTPSTTTPTQAGFLRHVLRGDSFREHNAVLTHTLKHPSSAGSTEAAATLDAATRNGLLTNANLVALHGNRRQRRRLMEALSLLHQYARHTHTHESPPLLTLPKKPPAGAKLPLRLCLLAVASWLPCSPRCPVASCAPLRRWQPYWRHALMWRLQWRCMCSSTGACAPPSLTGKRRWCDPGGNQRCSSLAQTASLYYPCPTHCCAKRGRGSWQSTCQS